MPGAVVAVVCFLTVAFVVDRVIVPAVSLRLTMAGYANLIFADTLISWFVLDTVVARRSIYAFFNILEPPLSPLLRFWRRVMLLGSGLATVGALLALKSSVTGAISELKGQDLALLLGPALAAFGWMYTAFEKEKSDRASKTLSAIQEQLYSQHIRSIAAQLRAFRRHCRDHFGDSLDHPLVLGRMTLRMGDIPADRRPDGDPDRTLGGAADEFLNALDLLAFGVRQGELDLRAVEMVLRQRLVRNAYTFTDYIWQETGATLVNSGDPLNSRYRATNRIWEHYLWLVENLDILPEDNIHRADIVLPPNPPPFVERR